MAEHIPFVTGEDVAKVVVGSYADSEFVRVPLDRAPKLLSRLSGSMKVWLDPCVDGLDRPVSHRDNSWLSFIRQFPNFDKLEEIAAEPKATVASQVSMFVNAIMDKCVQHQPDWITVPQLPLRDTKRNKINRELAIASGKWKTSNAGFTGRLILPLIFTNQKQTNTARKPKVEQAERRYREAHADGFWVVEQSLEDDKGSPTLNKRLSALIALHEELNERISSSIRIAGPYWGFNLVLWAKGLIEYPAIGVGSGYQYFLAGSPARKPSLKLALPPLRRRVAIGSGFSFRNWLDEVLMKLAATHPARREFQEIRQHYTELKAPEAARMQVARFYKRWFETIAAVPDAGRSMALFQDLSVAYALGKSLPALPSETGTARRAEAVAEPLMLRCL